MDFIWQNIGQSFEHSQVSEHNEAIISWDVYFKKIRFFSGSFWSTLELSLWLFGGVFDDSFIDSSYWHTGFYPQKKSKSLGRSDKIVPSYWMFWSSHSQVSNQNESIIGWDVCLWKKKHFFRGSFWNTLELFVVLWRLPINIFYPQKKKILMRSDKKWPISWTFWSSYSQVSKQNGLITSLDVYFFKIRFFIGSLGHTGIVFMVLWRLNMFVMIHL